MSRLIDLSDKKFGRLTVIERNGSDKFNRARWKCNCECGNVTTVDSRHLRSGATKSCGCLNVDIVRKRMTTHNLTKDYRNMINVWSAMISRCTKETAIGYEYYGGRGIRVCDDWLESFENFYEWAINNGYDESLTIDRIDNNGNYEPDNCRWVDMIVQHNNRSNNANYTIDGKTKTLTMWCREYNKNYERVRGRLRLGWSIEDALEL